MINKVSQHFNKGMNRDLSDSKVSNEFVYENYNIRITENEGDTLLSVTNEKGNIQVDIFDELNQEELFEIKGEYCGHCIADKYLTLFTQDDNTNYIYRLTFNNDIVLGKQLFSGELNITKENPVECIADIQTENIIRIYWVDKNNQPRAINILDEENIKNYDEYSFDFAIYLNDIYTINVESDYQKYGEFPSGVIQYFVTGILYNRESSILCQSNLLPLKNQDRGLSPTENYYFSNSIIFNANIDMFEKYILYSIERTSENTEPIARKVTEFDLIQDVKPGVGIIGFYKNVYDDGMYGESISASDLLYKGSEVINAETFAEKDNTLFLGNINLKSAKMSNDLIKLVSDNSNYSIEDYYIDESIPYSSNGLIYPYLRAGNYYRIGIQFKDRWGKWSSVFYIDDFLVRKQAQITQVLTTKGDYDSNTYIKIPNVKVNILNNNLKDMLEKENFISSRLLIVLPTEGERGVIAQGVLNYNVLNIGDRDANVSYSDSSWFWRTISSVASAGPSSSARDPNGSSWENGRPAPPSSEAGQEGNSGNNSTSSSDVVQEFRPYYPLKFADTLAAEIQTQNFNDFNDAYQDKSRDIGQYLIDPEVMDFYSPDIENYHKDLIPKQQLNLKIVGYCEDGFTEDGNYFPNSYKYNSRCTVENPIGITPLTARFANNKNFYNVSTSFVDSFYNQDNKKSVLFKFLDGSQNVGLNYAVYPWHRDGSLNNDVARDGRTAVLKRKIFSKYHKFRTFNTGESVDINLNSDFYKFDNTIDFLKIKIGDENKLYRGNVNTLVSTRTCATPIYIARYDTLQYVTTGESERKDYSQIPGLSTGTSSSTVNTGRATDYITGFDSCVLRKDTSNTPIELIPLNYYGITQYGSTYIEHVKDAPDRWIESRAVLLKNPNTTAATSADPVSIKYKTVNHGVFAVDKPIWNSNSIVVPSTYLWFANKNTNSTINTYNAPSGEYSLFLANLYNTSLDYDSIFGGRSEYALKNSLWIPASEEYSIKSNNSLVVNTGDTYLQRYEVLKTFPYTNEDKNSIIEIGSFLIESYRNLFGRYDRNFNLGDYTIVNETNFGLYNDVYNQKNNFLNYRYLPKDYLETNEYKNQFMWTLEHTPGADIDNWTNLSYGSFYNVDGKNCEIRAIRRFRDTLIGFQDSGIFEILFNSRSQLSTTNGMPIELGNSGKVDGVRYLTNKQGCINKWSIIETPYGLYFIDDLNYSINRLNGQSFDNLTDSLGFAQWAKDTIIPYKKWNINNNGFRTYYDRILNDVYFSHDNKSIVYSEKLNQFMSFIDYRSDYVLDNINNKFLSFNNKLWYNREGNYNSFFGNKKDYYITYRIAPDAYLNKLFNNIEYITTENSYTSNYTDLIVTGVNQYGESDLTKRDKLPPFNLQKKFNVWRANIPREKGKTLNRIQSPWIYLTLKSDKDKRKTEERIELHDLLVKYSVI